MRSYTERIRRTSTKRPAPPTSAERRRWSSSGPLRGAIRCESCDGCERKCDGCAGCDGCEASAGTQNPPPERPYEFKSRLRHQRNRSGIADVNAPPDGALSPHHVLTAYQWCRAPPSRSPFRALGRGRRIRFRVSRAIWDDCSCVGGSCGLYGAFGPRRCPLGAAAGTSGIGESGTRCLGRARRGCKGVGGARRRV